MLCRKIPLAADPAVKLQTPKNKPTNQHPLIQPQSNTVMKTIIHSSILLALASSGIAFGAATATTIPVGYETLAVTSGFNYLGARLQTPVLVAGLITAKDASSITCGTTDLGALLADTTIYILEVVNANGITQEFLGSAAIGSVLTTPAGLTAKLAVNDPYQIRTAPTLASTFGPANEAGLDTGFFGPGGDIIYLPNPSAPGGFDQYYYDSGQSSYADFNGTAVDGATVAYNYSDGLVVFATGVGTPTLTVSGEVKKGSTGYTMAADAFNYYSSISPAGATLASAFDAAIPTLDQGFFGPGGDIIYVPNKASAGGFDQYYYDSGQTSWADFNGTPVTATTISLPSGVVIFNTGAASDLVNTPPSFYSSF